MWEIRQPQRPDFCGQPPCHLCFVWAGPDGNVEPEEKVAEDMLGRQAKNDLERVQIKQICEAAHQGVWNKKPVPAPPTPSKSVFEPLGGLDDPEPEPVAEHVDIGMSPRERMQRQLNLTKGVRASPKPQPPSLDALADAGELEARLDALEIELEPESESLLKKLAEAEVRKTRNDPYPDEREEFNRQMRREKERIMNMTIQQIWEDPKAPIRPVVPKSSFRNQYPDESNQNYRLRRLNWEANQRQKDAAKMFSWDIEGAKK